MKNAPKPRELFVTEISFSAEEEDLRKLFVLFGTVTSVHMVNEPKTGKFKGTAFVRMGSPAEAKDACVNLDGTYLIDRCIKVSLARPKDETKPGGKRGSGKTAKARQGGKQKR